MVYTRHSRATLQRAPKRPIFLDFCAKHDEQGGDSEVRSTKVIARRSAVPYEGHVVQSRLPHLLLCAFTIPPVTYTIP